MNTPAKAAVDDVTSDALAKLALGDPELLGEGLQLRRDAGATPAELIGVLRAVAPQVGLPRIVAAAPELMVALGLALPDGPPGMV